jgi:plastocyanin
VGIRTEQKAGGAIVRKTALLRVLFAAPLLFVFAAAVVAFPLAAGSTPLAIELVAQEFLLSPKNVVAQPGDITFIVKNEGEIEHNLVVGLPGGKALAQIAIIEPGETMRVKASLPAGTYRLYCSLPGHREAGMVATLRVNP